MTVTVFQRCAGPVMIVVLAAISTSCPIAAKRSAAQASSEVRMMQDDGLVATIFRTKDGGKVTAFLPLNVQPNDAEIGGSVERQLPSNLQGSSDEAAAEISGVVTVEPASKKAQLPPVTVPPNGSGFSCPVPSDGKYIVTYHPPGGSPCSTTITCPPSAAPPQSNSCGIPQLTSCGGDLHVSMAPGSDPAKNSCVMGGQQCQCRAWSGEGCVFHVPPSAQLPPGPCSVVVQRDNRMACGQTHVAQVKMTCTPNHLKSGQPCQVTTTVFCPGLQEVKNGTLKITNYNPAVLDMADKVVPLPSDPNTTAPSTGDLLKRDGLATIDRLKQQLGTLPPATAQKISSAIEQMQSKLSK